MHNRPPERLLLDQALAALHAQGVDTVEAGAAHGTVGWVMAELPEHGHLREPRETGRQRQLARAGTLLDRRAEAYARTLRPKLVARRLHAGDPRWLHRDGGPGPGALPWST